MTKRRILFRGRALIDEQRFYEEGEAQIDDVLLPANRTYRLHFHQDAIDVSFADARPFVNEMRRNEERKQ